IFRLVYYLCGCKKPFSRLWISSMEDAAIREGFKNLRPGSEYDRLFEAALCRERADWIVGINATRLFSVLYGKTLHVGRVLSPTLSMAVVREAEIAAFVQESFYTVELALPGVKASGKRLKEKEAALQLADECADSTATVTKYVCKEKSEKPPALYDLTTLQRDANRQLGYTAQQTLDYAQGLYEKKIITYPRTDSRYLTDDMEEMVPGLASMAARIAGLYDDKDDEFDEEDDSISRLIDSSKVSDHHAIIPTMSAGEEELSALPSGEREILQLIAVRLAEAVAGPCRYEEVTAEFEYSGMPFAAKGKTILKEGWKAIEKEENEARQRRSRSKRGNSNNNHPGISEKESEVSAPLPLMEIGDRFPVKSADVKEGKTKPRPHYTEDTLLSAMEHAGTEDMPDDAERKGIGTPATRAGVIERLVTRGFLSRAGNGKTKYLIPTEKGTALITVLPEQLQSPSMTADWEEKLLAIERGEYSPEEFMDGIAAMITNLVETYEPAEDSAVILPAKRESLGKCPACGADVVEYPKSYSCTNRQCKFALWKENRYFESIGKQMSENAARQLLKNGSIRLKHCYSRRKDRYFDTTVSMTLDPDGKVQFRMGKDNK
ncbi:MAG: DNA topoisomerase, partial [Clostridiales bacterium]|nr:DNA topoisomerase [Clostridiales bacterium]